MVVDKGTRHRMIEDIEGQTETKPVFDDMHSIVENCVELCELASR